MVLFCTAGVGKKEKVNTIHLIFSWYRRSGAVAVTLIQKNQMPMLRMPAIDVITKYTVMTVIKM